MTGKDAVRIFVRTFAALAGAALIAVQGLDWATADAIKNNGAALGLALLSALIGAIVAVGWAYVASPAETQLGKSIRAAVEKIVGGVGVVVINQVGDLVDLANLIPALLIAAVLAFGITYLSYVAPPAEPEPGG